MKLTLADNTTERGRFVRSSILRLAILCIAIAAAGPTAFIFAAAEDGEQSPDPLGDIVQDMNVASRWLSKLATDALTQETQKDAVDKLDKLIARLEKQAQSGNGGQKSPNPSRPMADSMIKSGPGGMGKLHAADQDGKHWADLPAHERERILQSMTEGFPAHYQGVLEAYFKRIAEEKPLKAEEQAPASSNPMGTASSSGTSDTTPSGSLPKENPSKNSETKTNLAK
ncbi:MAG TPA: hypothetical protein VGI75_15350 [Pirellulales bacterium]